MDNLAVSKAAWILFRIREGDENLTDLYNPCCSLAFFLQFHDKTQQPKDTKSLNCVGNQWFSNKSLGGASRFKNQPLFRNITNYNGKPHPIPSKYKSTMIGFFSYNQIKSVGFLRLMILSSQPTTVSESNLGGVLKDLIGHLIFWTCLHLNKQIWFISPELPRNLPSKTKNAMVFHMFLDAQKQR